MRDIDLLVDRGALEGAIDDANLSRTLRDTAQMTRATQRARAIPQVPGGQLQLWAAGPRQRSLFALMMRPEDAFATVAHGGRHHDVPGAGTPPRHPLRVLPGTAWA